MVDSGKYGPLLEKEVVEVHCLNLPAGKVSLSALWRLYQLIRKNKPDIVQTWMYHADLIGSAVAKLAGIKQIYWNVRQSDLEPGKSKHSTIWVAKACAFVSGWIPKKIVYCAHGAKAVHEALCNKSGLGDIVEFNIKTPDDLKILFTGDHYSYPIAVQINEKEYIMPEVASHSNQYFCEYSSTDENNKKFKSNLSKKFYLKGLEHQRIVDGTLLHHENHWYLFFGEQKDAHTVLHLWSASALKKKFTVHPKSPICVNPSSARMGGCIVSHNDLIYRLGQNNDRGYGESIAILNIEHLSPQNYMEKLAGTVSIYNRKGPHTIDFDMQNNRILFDYYQDEFSIFSGVRRIKAKISKK